MNHYRKILPLLKDAFKAGRVYDQGNILLFDDFEDYFKTLNTDLTLDEAKVWVEKELRKLYEEQVPVEQLEDHARIQVIFLTVGNSEAIEDIEPFEDHVSDVILELTLKSIEAL